MPDCKTYRITNLDQLRLDLKQHGVDLPAGNSGTLQGKHGVQVSFEYDSATSSLKLCIVHRPIFVPAGDVWNFLDQALKAYRV